MEFYVNIWVYVRYIPILCQKYDCVIMEVCTVNISVDETKKLFIFIDCIVCKEFVQKMLRM